MEGLSVLFGFAVIVVSVSNVLKSLVKIKFPEAKVGLIFAIICGMLVSIPYGKGIFNIILGVEYAECLFPLVMQYVDLIFTGFLLTMGSKIGTDLFDVIKGKQPDTTHVVNKVVVEDNDMDKFVDQVKDMQNRNTLK